MEKNTTDFVSVSQGMSHTVAVKADGSLWAWGSNINGQLGLGDNGSDTHKTTPTRVGTDMDWVMITCGGYHTVAVKADGSLWAWGSNINGQLGLGCIDPSVCITTPTRVGDANDWKSITCGYEHTMGLKQDGSLWGWGDNSNYQLGLDVSTTSSILEPICINTDKNWSHISSNGTHNAAIKQDGSLWGWGKFHHHYMPSTNYIGHCTPTQLSKDLDWVEVDVGHCHTIARKSDGSMWTYGFNSGGQMGLGHTTSCEYIHELTMIGDSYDWLTFSCGRDHTTAIKKDGSLWACGDNNDGQIGLWDTPYLDTFTNICYDRTYSNTFSGYTHNIAIADDNSIYSWGCNVNGQLGLNHFREQNTPYTVPL